MTPEIIVRDEFIVVGIRTVLETNDSVGALWSEHFLPRRSEIKNVEKAYYAVFNALSDDSCGRYEYVAGVVTNSLEDIPDGMVGWVIPSGKYAEITASGLQSIARICRGVLTDWLPDSGFQQVAGPYFAYTENERPDAPDAIWKINVPIETPEVLAEMKTWLSDN
jgi:Uncharacterized protein conserved in bacteria